MGPIIGADFLCFYNLLFNIRHQRLIDNITNLTANGASVETYGSHIKVLARSSHQHAMLQHFPDIIRPAGIPGNPGTLQCITFAPCLDHLSLRTHGS
jgi:hypothetical protein